MKCYDNASPMNSLRCMNCGEPIPVDFVNDEEKVAFCPKCGEYTLATDDQRQLKTYSVRELLSGEPPTNVTIGLGKDGARVYIVAPADQKLQIRNVLCSLTVLVVSLVALFSLDADFGETVRNWLVRQGVLPRVPGFVDAALLFLAITGAAIAFLLAFVFLSRLTNLRLVVGTDELLAQNWWLGCVRMGLTRRFRRCSEAVVSYETEACAYAIRKTSKPAKHIVRVYDRHMQELMSCRDARTAQYVRAVVLEWLGKVGRFRPFVCRRCGAEISSPGVDMKAERVSCPSCGFGCDLAVAETHRETLRKRELPAGITVLGNGTRLQYRPGWRIDVRILAVLPHLLAASCLCWKFAHREDGHAILWLLLGVSVWVSALAWFAVSLVLSRFRRFEIACADERVVCESRGLFGKHRRDVSLAGTCIALKFDKNGTRLGLVTNLKDKNEQSIELARHLPPDACTAMTNWLNARLLKVKEVNQ